MLVNVVRGKKRGEKMEKQTVVKSKAVVNQFKDGTYHYVSDCLDKNLDGLTFDEVMEQIDIFIRGSVPLWQEGKLELIASKKVDETIA